MTEEQIRALIDGLRAQGMTDEIIADMLARGSGVTPDQLPADFAQGIGLDQLLVPPAQPATEAPAWMDDAQASQWEALLPDQRDPYAFSQSAKRPVEIEDLPTRAAIDKEVAGATNDQLAYLMAQATGGGGEILDPWADAGDMSGGRQGLRASQGTASERAGAQSAGAAAMAAGKQASEAGQLAKVAEQGAANEWMEYGGLAAGLAGTALGVAAPFLERDKKYEASLKRRVGGDTVARQEMDYAAGQMRRNIMGSAMGRRDISPALAMRNAQMAQAQSTNQMMARAAMASAQERQMAENELAQIRKQRTGQAIDAGLAGLSQVGGFMASQAAAQKQDARSAQQLKAYQDRTAAMRR